jgi:hypothetical protein
MTPLAQYRLINLGIAESAFGSPAEAVAWSGVMQGQDYRGGKWSVGCRVAGSSESSIEQAIAQAQVLRTWILRGTLHLVAPADIDWLLALCGPRLIKSNAGRYRQLGLDEATMQRANGILSHALEGGKRLMRPDLFAILEQEGISTEGQRGVYMLQRASLDRLICQGVAPRNVPTFMSLPEVVAPSAPLSRPEAIARLAQRYFHSHGPATVHDFAWWAALPVTEARAGLEAVKGGLTSITHSEQVYWLPADQSERSPQQSVYLLAGFDEYILGYQQRDLVLPSQHAQQVVPGNNGVFFPTIASNGQIVGTWKRADKRGQVILTPTPFEGLSAADWEGVEAAAHAYGDYLGQLVQVVQS